jgi:Cu/Ag efflux protein CusF
MRIIMIRSTMMALVVAAAMITSRSVWAAAQVTDEKPVEQVAEAKSDVGAGKILVADAKSGTITIRHKKENKTFTVAPDCKFNGFEKKDATLADVKAGDRAKVLYTQEGDKLVARQIDRAESKKDAQKAPKEK